MVRATNMARRQVFTAVTVAVLLALFPAVRGAAAAPRSSRSSGSSGSSLPRSSGTGELPSWQHKSANQIRLVADAFDPLEDAGPTVASIPVRTSVPAGVEVHWLVQARDMDFRGVTRAITAAGATVGGFVPDAAYVVRGTDAQISAIAASPSVRWAGLYQPMWKVPTRIGAFPGLMELSGTQQLKVYGFHDDPTVARLADHLAAISGVEVTAESGSVVEVEASTAAVPAIAALSSVQWVEAKGRLAGLNANARWVNDTGVRDLYSATLPSRLTGAGQTAGVADTAINYTTSANGTANSYFRDCRSGGCVKADYEQVTAGPGTDDANLRNIKANHTNHRKVVAFFDIGAAGPNPPDESSHGTHVSGSVAGDTGTRGTWDRADGIAPGARLVSQNIGTPSGGLGGPTDDYELWRQAYRPRNPGSVPTTYTPSDYANYRPNEDARTHNNSYGLTVPIVSLGSAEAADRFVWDHEDMFIVSSAGNSGPDAGSVGAPSIARNVVTSAASANGRQPMVSIDSIASFSSHGPGQSGDFGVDLATPGQIVVSAKGGTNDDEHVLQGTSMSGPLLTGLATLVRQYFFDGYAATGAGSTPTARRASGIAAGARGAARKTNPSAALVRATMVNGAERMRGYYSGLQGSQRALDGQYPSAGQGFGLVNLRNSLYFDDSQGKSQRSTWFQDVYRGDDAAFDVGATGAAAVRNYPVHVAAGSPLNVTLAFTDAPAALGAGSVAVNNLDLQVVAPNGAVYSGNNFNTETNPGAADHATLTGSVSDPVNPVEKVRIPTPVAGNYTIRVRGATVAMGPQGFALAASGRLSQVDGPAFTPGAAQQRNAAGDPTISNVVVTPVSSDLAKVTFATSEPTTALVRANVGGSSVDYVDNYNLGFDGYKGSQEGPIGCAGTQASSCVETSAAYANKPVLGTRHEVLVTGLSAGATYSLQLRATDLSGALATTSRSLKTSTAVFAPVADDIAQYASADTDPIDPEIIDGTGRRTATQLYAGKLDASTGALGAFMFRLPTSVNPAKIKGAAVELVSAHDLTNHYKDDTNVFVDLLPQTKEPSFRTNNYQTIHTAPSEARLNARTGYRRGGYQTYQFSFGCGDLSKLKSSLTTLTDGGRAAAFRFDAETSAEVSLFSAEFGYNRRSAGADLRPRLVLFTDDGQGNVTNPQPCNASAAAPKISNIGVQSAFDPGDVDNATVSWNTDIPSDSIVLFRRKGSVGGWTQVGTPARSTVHNVQVFGLDPNQDYEFAVRSTGCNGRATTNDNGGKGYDFFVAPSTPIPTDDYFFTGQASDQATKGTENPTATFQATKPTGAVPIVQTTTAVANESFVNNNLAASWTGPYPAGPVHGPLTVSLYASGVSGAVNGVPISVTVFADPDFSADADGEQPDRIVATGTITGTAGPPGAPALITGKIPVVDGAPSVQSRLHVQVVSGDITEPVTLQMVYGSASAASSFEEPTADVDQGEQQASAGPRIPPPSAGSSGLNVAAVPTRGAPTAADVAAGTARCAPVRYQVPSGGTPSLRISDVNEWEGSAATGNHPVSVPVTLSAPTNHQVTVHYATRNGTASAPSDYLATSGTLTFAPGQASSAVLVTFVGENRPEPDERFFIDLSSPVGATIADSSGTVTIRKFQ